MAAASSCARLSLCIIVEALTGSQPGSSEPAWPVAWMKVAWLRGAIAYMNPVKSRVRYCRQQGRDDGVLPVL
jgi:hypothetical protein